MALRPVATLRGVAPTAVCGLCAPTKGLASALFGAELLALLLLLTLLSLLLFTQGTLSRLLPVSFPGLGSCLSLLQARLQLCLRRLVALGIPWEWRGGRAHYRRCGAILLATCLDTVPQAR